MGYGRMAERFTCGTIMREDAMRAVTKTMMLLGLAAAIPACGEDRAEQNVAIDINNAAPEDIEALPADESSATPSEELATGAQNADANEVEATTNSY